MAFLSDKYLWKGAWCLLLMLLATPALAVDESKRDTEVLKRQIAGEKKASKAAAESQKRKELADLGEVTFAQVMADPDNVELNFAFAKQQVADNNLLGAAGTLERILIVNPDLHPVRLFYAVVLYRLDSLSEAEVQLDTLAGSSIPSSVRLEVDQFQKKIKQQKKKTKISLRQSVGYGFDDNRNAAPSSKRAFALAVLATTFRSTAQQRDSSFINATSVEVTHDPGFAAGHEIFANGTYYLQEQTKLDNLDLAAFQYETGIRWKTPWFDFVPSYQGGHISLSRESFMRTQAGNFAFEKSLNPKWDVYGVYKIERQDPLAISENLFAAERKGTEHSYKLGASYILTKSMRVGTEVLYSNKNAEEDFNAYERVSWRMNHLWLLGKGQFISNNVDFILDYYDEPDVAVVGRIRRDKGFRYNVTYGAPLTTLYIGKILPKFMQDINLTLTYEFYRALSNITNNTYKNNRFQALLTKKWEF